MPVSPALAPLWWPERPSLESKRAHSAQLDRPSARLPKGAEGRRLRIRGFDWAMGRGWAESTAAARTAIHDIAGARHSL